MPKMLPKGKKEVHYALIEGIKNTVIFTYSLYSPPQNWFSPKQEKQAILSSVICLSLPISNVQTKH